MAVTINLTGVTRRLSSGAIDRGRYAVAHQAMADMSNFVPLESSVLRQTVSVTPDGKSITYDTPYARAQFYGTNGKAVFRDYTTPGTGPRWDLKAKGLFMNDWIQGFTRGADW